MTNLLLLQLCDSNFPIGSFSHSYGFETYMQKQRITDAASFAEWLAQYLTNQVISSDGLGMRFCHEALLQEDWQRVAEVNQELNAQLIPSEIRQANRKMGQQFLKIGRELLGDEGTVAQLKEHVNEPHPAVVFTVLAASSQATIEEIITTYLFNLVTTLVQNAVRGVPIGQLAGQKLIYAYQEKIQSWTAQIMELTAHAFGSVAPGIEISQMQHEHLFARNFMS